jgi:hypothetical protein
MTATAGSAANTKCGLRDLGAYVVIKAFTVVKSSANVNVVLMRDPNGASGYNGDWKSSDSEWTSGNKAKVPYGVDPTATAWINKGFFVLPETAFAKGSGASDRCISYVMFGINEPGYVSSRYDAEVNTDLTDYNPSLGATKSAVQKFNAQFTIDVPASATGSIYILTDLYPIGVVPYVCRKAGFTTTTKYTSSVQGTRAGAANAADYYTPVVYTGVFGNGDSTSTTT